VWQDFPRLALSTAAVTNSPRFFTRLAVFFPSPADFLFLSSLQSASTPQATLVRKWAFLFGLTRVLIFSQFRRAMPAPRFFHFFWIPALLWDIVVSPLVMLFCLKWRVGRDAAVSAFLSNCNHPSPQTLKSLLAVPCTFV